MKRLHFAQFTLLLKMWGLGAALFLLPACSGLIIVQPAPSPTPPAGELTPASTIVETLPAITGPASLPRRIVAEAVKLDAPVVAMDWQLDTGAAGQTVSAWNVPENEAGWHQNSAVPGQGSNVIISGHNNSTGGHVFGPLNDLTLGDLITVWAGETEHTYRVSQKQIVRTFGASQETLNYLQQVTRPTPSEQLTLITCWPNWTNTHRLIIVAQPSSEGE